MALRKWEADLARRQRAQFGVFSRAQALELGAPPATIDGRVRSGRHRCLLPGVYCEAGVPDSWDVRAMAALLWAGGDAVLARGSAARCLGLPVPATATDLLHLLVSERCFVVPSGIVVHRTRHLHPAHMTAHGSLRLTAAPRTICDLAGDLRPVDLRRLVAAAARDQLVDATTLRAVMRSLGRLRGAPRLRAIVDELSPLDAQCRTEFETIYLRMARRHGIEPTAMNHPVRDGGGGRRYLDAVYLPEHVWVELDSKKFHDTLLDRNDDAARSDDIERAGVWRDPLRFTWDDVTKRPDEVAAQVRAALAAARASGVEAPA